MSKTKFVLRVVLFSLTLFIALSFDLFLFKSYEDIVIGREIYLSIRKSKVKKKVKVLIIGDSVAKQLYDNETYNNEIYSLTTNQAISLAGQYILLKNFIDNNQGNLPGEIILIMVPKSFNNNLDQIYSYNYFLKPFYKSEYKSMITDTCQKLINKIPFYFLSQQPLVVNTNWCPTYVSKDEPYQFISPLSTNYLLKIKELCLKNHLPIKFFCPPIKASGFANAIAHAKRHTLIEKSGFKNEFAYYFKSITTLPDSMYQDDAHLKREYIPTDYYNLQRN